MPRRALVACAALALLTSCGHPQPVTVYKTKEVKVPVTVPCPTPDVPKVEGPDLAPANSTIFEAAQYTAARIYALRGENKGLRAALEACKETPAESP